MKFEADGKSYELKYTVNGMADLEEVTGRPFSDIMTSGEFSAVRALFYAGLSDTNPKLTLRGAGAVLEAYLAEGHGLEDAFELVNKATEQAGFLQAGKATPKRKPSRSGNSTAK